MQQEKNRQQLEELDILENFVQLGYDLPYGPYVLFNRLASRYPLHFVQFMHEHRYGTDPATPGTIYRHLPIALAAVDTLSQELEHYLTYEPKSEEERAVFLDAADKLENRLWARNFSDPRFTHFLDIDQYTDDEGGFGIESLFYFRDGATLRIQLTGREGNPLGSEDFPVPGGQGNIKSILTAYLLHYFSAAGNHSGDTVYRWSNIISRHQFEQLRLKGADIIQHRKEEAKLLAEHNELITYCKQQGLSPRPEGSCETNWYARCPCGGSHPIMIFTTSNQWACGYCKKKGGLEELKQLLEFRDKKGLQ